MRGRKSSHTREEAHASGVETGLRQALTAVLNILAL
jgi:hypothetical protein